MATTFKVGIEFRGVYHFFDKIQPRNVRAGDTTINGTHKVLSIRKTSDGQFLAKLSGLPGTHRITRIQFSKSNARSR